MKTICVVIASALNELLKGADGGRESREDFFDFVVDKDNAFFTRHTADHLRSFGARGERKQLRCQVRKEDK